MYPFNRTPITAGELNDLLRRAVLTKAPVAVVQAIATAYIQLADAQGNRIVTIESADEAAEIYTEQYAQVTGVIPSETPDYLVHLPRAVIGYLARAQAAQDCPVHAQPPRDARADARIIVGDFTPSPRDPHD